MDRELLRRLGTHVPPPGTEPVIPLPGQTVSGQRFWQRGPRVGMAVQTPDRVIPPHTRDYAELICQCAGSGTYLVNDREVTLEEGELLLLGQNTLLEIREQREDALSVRFFIKPELLGDTLRFLGSEETPLREFVLRCLGQETPYGYLHFRVGGVKMVENLVENLILYFLDGAVSRRAIPMFTVGVLFVHLLEQTDRLVMGVREQQAVLRVLQYIENNYAHANLNQAARALHCDVSWLSREIHRRTGRTFTELVQERRLNQAAWLLKNTRQKVSDVALSVGYENVSYFHRIFGKRFGLSPKKYRDSE